MKLKTSFYVVLRFWKKYFSGYSGDFKRIKEIKMLDNGEKCLLNFIIIIYYFYYFSEIFLLKLTLIRDENINQ